jgi:hypothetical protein
MLAGVCGMSQPSKGLFPHSGLGSRTTGTLVFEADIRADRQWQVFRDQTTHGESDMQQSIYDPLAGAWRYQLRRSVSIGWAAVCARKRPMNGGYSRSTN